MAVNIFVTDPDDELLSSGTRDPLGFEVLWTNFGTEALPYVNTQSIGAVNYVVVSVLQHWIDEYVHDRGDDLSAYLENETEQISLVEGLTVVAEQLLVYSVLERGEDPSRLYGVQTASRLSGRDVRVGPFDDQTILARQQNTGLFARYEAPLTEMEVFEESWNGGRRPRLEGVWRSRIEERFDGLRHDAEEFSATLKGIFDVFDGVIEEGGTEVPFSRFREVSGAVDGMCRLRSLESVGRVAGELEEAMGVAGEAETSQRYVWEVLGSDSIREVGDLDPCEVFKKAQERAGEGETAQTLNDILRLESVLAPVEVVFERIWHTTGRVRDDEIVTGCVDWLTDREKAVWHDLERLRKDRKPMAGSRAGQYRLSELARITRETSEPLTFVRELVDYHREIMDERDANPWVELDGGRAEALNTGYAPQDHEDWWQAEDKWGSRDYYLGEFRDFREDVVEAKGGRS